MRKFNIFIACIFFLVSISGIAFADDCPDDTATAKQAAKEADKFIKELFKNNVPPAKTYNDMLEDCLGKLTAGFNISILGLLPDINALLAGLCKKIMSELKIPDLDFDMNVDLATSKYEVPTVKVPITIQDAWTEAWPIK